MIHSPALIRAAIGPPLGSDAPRRRPIGRIGGVIGSTLEGVCDQLAAGDPTGQLGQLCDGLGSLPI